MTAVMNSSENDLNPDSPRIKPQYLQDFFDLRMTTCKENQLGDITPVPQHILLIKFLAQTSRAEAFYCSLIS
ncbi:hypothetical protein CEXT_55111 [Caerostris extrusa]|uniref:Uncharacterized protein n=1 Tax=Caerostris extrusa TaxID=172846 RepID=A0AAV4R864_CAEEX|nr:hypothetical protein CEXT_55111 [Caerostris extrusa]